MLNKKPHKAGQPQPQGGRANPNFKPEKANRHPEKRSLTPTQEKEGPNNPKEGRADPFPKSGNDMFVIFYKTICPSPSGSGLAPPLPFFLAGPLTFPFPPFWLANPDPKGQPSPEKEDRPLPREGRANPTGGANLKLEKKEEPPLRKLPTPSQRGRTNLHAEKEGSKPPARERKTKKKENDSYEEQEKLKLNRQH